LAKYANVLFFWRHLLNEAAIEEAQVARKSSVEPLWSSINLDLNGINWVIVGGEKRPKANAFELDWGRSLRDQCRSENVAFFVKQLGANPRNNGEPIKLNNGHGGDWRRMAGGLRIREMPTEFQEESSQSPVADASVCIVSR